MFWIIIDVVFLIGLGVIGSEQVSNVGNFSAMFVNENNEMNTDTLDLIEYDTGTNNFAPLEMVSLGFSYMNNVINLVKHLTTLLGAPLHFLHEVGAPEMVTTLVSVIWISMGFFGIAGIVMGRRF